jgi:uncharacterized membrane protein
MFNRVRQRADLIAAFVGAIALAAALPTEQFVELARLVIQVGLSFAAVCLVAFVAPGLICGDWLQSVIQTIRALRLAQGWVPAQPSANGCATPADASSVLLPPPRSIS